MEKLRYALISIKLQQEKWERLRYAFISIIDNKGETGKVAVSIDQH